MSDCPVAQAYVGLDANEYEIVGMVLEDDEGYEHGFAAQVLEDLTGQPLTEEDIETHRTQGCRCRGVPRYSEAG